MPDAGPEIPRVEELVGETGEKRDRYGRLVAIATVLTTMIAALVGFAQVNALRIHDQADARAEADGALALAQSAVNRGRAQVMIDRFNLLTQDVRNANDASLYEQFGTSTPTIRLTATRWNSIASQTETDTSAIAASAGIPYICSPSLQAHCPSSDSLFSPQDDPRYPALYLQGAQYSAYRLTALRDAANEQADDAESAFVHYAAALTMLAVAVFLFGYSLTPQGRSRHLLYARVATAFVVIAGLWALFQALSPVEQPPDAAAGAFATGEIDLNVGDYPAAISDFSHALKLRPRFVDAYFDRAEAEYDAGLPHAEVDLEELPTTAGPNTIPTIAALNAAVEDDERGRAEGSDSATELLDLGRNLFERGVIKHHLGDLRASRSYLSLALNQLRGQQSATYFTIGAELRLAQDDLALGNSRAAQEYRAAESQFHLPDVPTESVVAAALSDLNLIEANYPKLAGKVGATEQQIVALGEKGFLTPGGRTPSPSTTPVTLGGVSAQPDPGHALYLISRPGSFDPFHDSLSVQWEYKDPLHGEWDVLPEISGPVVPGELTRADPGYASNNTSYVASSSPATCLPPGKYRVQLYVDGQLAGSATAPGSWPALHAVRFSDVDGAMCVPRGWSALPGAKAGEDGYFAPKATAGALIFSIPKAALGPLTLTKTLELVVGGIKSGASFLSSLKPTEQPQPTQFFMSSSNGEQQHFVYQHGVAAAGVGTSTNGQVYVGIAWGPSSGDLVQAMFYSLSPL